MAVRYVHRSGHYCGQMCTANGWQWGLLQGEFLDKNELKMRQRIIQKGAFPQTTLLLVKAIKEKKIKSLKMRATIMYLFNIIKVAHSSMRYMKFSLLI